MEKSASDGSRGGKALPRKSSRTAPSETLLNIKRNMKQIAEESNSTMDVIKDDYEVAQNAINNIRLQTGVIYDELVIQHYCFWDQNYPENPDRFTSIIKRCNELGLIARCKRIPSRKATKEEIMEVHTSELFEILKSTTVEDNYEKLEDLASKYDSIYLNKSTFDCALLSAGCAIELIEAICTNEIGNGMAIIRPPGHHAMQNEFCGYCYFNNAALAAKHAINKMGLNRILLIDWDVHHGQGIQQTFYDDVRVLYFSIHRYQNGSFWPELRESDFDYIGDKSGKGCNFNIPLNATGLTDADYMAIFHQILLPVAYQYDPELIIISAGYDAAIGCPEGEMELTPAVFAHFTSSLLGLASGRMAVILEGGYCTKSLAEGAALTLRALLGDPPPRLCEFGSPSDSIVNTILNVISVQRPYWPCLRIQETYNAGSNSLSINVGKGNEIKSIFPPERRHLVSVRFESLKKEKPTHYETRNCYPAKPSAKFAAVFERRLDDLRSMTDLSVPVKRVAIAFDEVMTQHHSLLHADHPEKPERITATYRRFEEFGLLDRCVRVNTRKATRKELLMVHDEKYVDEIEKLAQLSDEELIRKSSAYDSVYFHSKTYECALYSAGCVLQIVDEVVFNRAQAGVAIVRPPGHHADINGAGGFCIFNNAALAARYALECRYLKRILLLDWDVHHGNGSQRIFESDNRVLNISLHRYNNGKFFPSSVNGNYDKIGIGQGKGFNVNIPWNSPGGGVGDSDYIAAFCSIILPIAYQFDPDLVIVAAGFDACVNDPLGSCKVTPEMFGHMTQWLTTLAKGKIILCLEGGYNVTSVSYAMTLCTKALLGDPLPSISSSLCPSPSTLETIRNVLMEHEKFWPCLRFNKIVPEGGLVKLKLPQKNEESRFSTDLQPGNAGEEKFKAKIGKSLSKSTVEKIGKKMPDGALKGGIGKIGTKMAGEKGAAVDSLVGTMQDVQIDTKSSNIDSDYKPQDANENTRRNNSNRPPLRDTDSENASNQSDRPTLVEYLSENMQMLLNEEMYAVIPQPGCPHLSEVQAVPQSGISVTTPCLDCNTTDENWICLVCYTVHCGRYVSQHMLAHNEESGHPLTLSFTDLSVWCYVCEAYIDNMVLYPAKNAVHRSKFGSDLQWSYE